MLKRSWRLYNFTIIVLGLAVGSWANLAVSQLDIYYGGLAILALIAVVLNIICGADKKSDSTKNEE